MITAGLYAWRRLTSKTVGSVPLTVGGMLGQGPVVSPEGYIVAWGGVFMILSLLSVFIPTLAGAVTGLILLTTLTLNFESASQSAAALIKQKSKSGGK